MNTCRYCSQAVSGDAAITHSYWQGLPFPCHPACKLSGEKREAFDCQCVDADCNDCKHYKRGKRPPPTISQLRRTDGTTVEVKHQANVFLGGWCNYLAIRVTAQPKKWSGMECFEHRRSGGAH